MKASPIQTQKAAPIPSPQLASIAADVHAPLRPETAMSYAVHQHAWRAPRTAAGIPLPAYAAPAVPMLPATGQKTHALHLNLLYAFEINGVGVISLILNITWKHNPDNINNKKCLIFILRCFIISYIRSLKGNINCFLHYFLANTGGAF